MNITIKCPSCGQEYELEPEQFQEGLEATCEKCGNSFPLEQKNIVQSASVLEEQETSYHKAPNKIEHNCIYSSYPSEAFQTTLALKNNDKRFKKVLIKCSDILKKICFAIAGIYFFGTFLALQEIDNAVYAFLLLISSAIIIGFNVLLGYFQNSFFHCFAQTLTHLEGIDSNTKAILLQLQAQASKKRNDF